MEKNNWRTENITSFKYDEIKLKDIKIAINKCLDKTTQEKIEDVNIAIKYCIDHEDWKGYVKAIERKTQYLRE